MRRPLHLHPAAVGWAHERVARQLPHGSAWSVSFAWNSQEAGLIHAQGYAECCASSVRFRTFGPRCGGGGP
jgi:hypothetical protein